MTKIKYSLRGFVTWEVQEKGVVVSQSQKTQNLILNQGFDFVAEYAFADCFMYCVAGAGNSAPNSSQTGLDAEISRTNQRIFSATAHGTETDENTFKIFRSFGFPEEVTDMTYREVGFSPQANIANNLFSRALFKNNTGTPIDVLVGEGQRLIVRYELLIDLFDSSLIVSQGILNDVTSSGVIKLQKFGLKGINSINGDTQDFDVIGSCNEPSLTASIFISPSSAALEPTGSSADRSSGSIQKTCGLSNYVPSSFERTKTVIFKPSLLPGIWRSCGVGPADNNGAAMVFDANQTKVENRAYLVNFTYFWGD